MSVKSRTGAASARCAPVIFHKPKPRSPPEPGRLRVPKACSAGRRLWSTAPPEVTLRFRFAIETLAWRLPFTTSLLWQFRLSVPARDARNTFHFGAAAHILETDASWRAHVCVSDRRGIRGLYSGRLSRAARHRGAAPFASGRAALRAEDRHYTIAGAQRGALAARQAGIAFGAALSRGAARNRGDLRWLDRWHRCHRPRVRRPDRVSTHTGRRQSRGAQRRPGARPRRNPVPHRRAPAARPRLPEKPGGLFRRSESGRSERGTGDPRRPHAGRSLRGPLLALREVAAQTGKPHRFGHGSDRLYLRHAPRTGRAPSAGDPGGRYVPALGGVLPRLSRDPGRFGRGLRLPHRARCRIPPQGAHAGRRVPDRRPVSATAHAAQPHVAGIRFA